MKKLVLIDGHSILNRAFFGMPELTNSEGFHTNAIYGFLNIMFRILDEEEPDYLVVAFDVHAPTFRHEMFKEYKGTRKPMAEELREQVPVMKELLQKMGIKTVEMPGFEADDILGTLAKKAESEGIEVSLVSGDRDLLQIASSHIKIRIPKTKGGKTEIEDYYEGDVLKTYEVTPLEFINLKALMGDTADNIPGVPKVGQKTATELIKTYHDLDNLYEHIDEISKKAVKESLENNKELADLSLKLATIKTDVDTGVIFDDCKVKNFFTDEAYVLFKKLEFKNYLGRFETKIDYSEITGNFKLVDDFNEASDIFSGLKKRSEPFAISLVFNDKEPDFLGVALSFDNKSFFIKKWMFISEDYIASSIKEIVTFSGGEIYTHNVKKLYAFADLEYEVTNRIKDVLIGAYLNNPLKNDYNVTDIANEYLNLLIKDKDQYAKKLSLEEAFDKFPEDTLNFVVFRAYVCLMAYPKIAERLKENNMLGLFDEMEMPLSYILYDMQRLGVKADSHALKDYSLMLGKNIEELEGRIYEEAGCEFNINSPKQLGEILFERLNIPGGKKTKTGYSTAADVLNKLAPDYPVVKDILDYRAYTKLKSTYADGLSAYIDENGRIHSNFNQTITATGRLSSTDPNLQNIPVRTELGRQLRKVFIPKEGCVFMDADYSQIELRVLASLSGDEELIRAYREHADIHRSTASNVFHIPYDEVTELDRRRAKAVNFGIVYGISAFGLSEDLEISQKEAKGYIEDYFKTYPAIKNYLDKLVIDAKDKGYALTYYGRRRPIPELSSSNFMQRSFGERVSMNSPIQGTAADIIKRAMIAVFKRLKRESLNTKLILQVHDELLLEVPSDEIEKAKAILSEEMQNATDLAVKMELDLKTGSNWYEAH